MVSPPKPVPYCSSSRGRILDQAASGLGRARRIAGAVSLPKVWPPRSSDGSSSSSTPRERDADILAVATGPGCRSSSGSHRSGPSGLRRGVQHETGVRRCSARRQATFPPAPKQLSGSQVSTRPPPKPNVESIDSKRHCPREPAGRPRKVSTAVFLLIGHKSRRALSREVAALSGQLLSGANAAVRRPRRRARR